MSNTRNNPTSPLEVARAYHHAWTSGDFDQAGEYLTDNLKTEVPINSYEGKADFLEAVRNFGSLVETTDMLAEFGDQNEALLLYDMSIAGLGQLRIAEHFRVEGERITRIRHVHDTATLREAGFGE